MQAFIGWQAEATHSKQLTVKAQMVARQWCAWLPPLDMLPSAMKHLDRCLRNGCLVPVPCRRSRSLATAFRTWSAYAAGCAELRAKAALLVGSLRTALLRRAFNSWAAHVQRRRAAEDKVGRGLRCRLHCL